MQTILVIVSISGCAGEVVVLLENRLVVKVAAPLKVRKQFRIMVLFYRM